ncbi:NADPH-dependent oxidoreductase [Arsenicitalea aurantiaca]|uniref:NADPH-dependent oxidoreductase n=1 Tax=Arsenicitalea aurantiaca TaxID=1783274 RepID=A0A433X7W2_9HYPH|nr:NAD(P)H-dependent oxidoreductase [Arsenicitalea aurantiaca]RUT30171.1 NADPH-dependent oxidoreductase [Arsenicitalea aurantiaca]
MARALTLCGSIRKGSYNEILRRHVSGKLVEAGAEVEDIDLGDYALPIFNEDIEAEGMPAAAVALAEKFAAADIVFIASPEYNSGASPLIVNTISWISRQRLGQFRKPVFGLGAVSSGKYGAIVGIGHLRDSLLKLGALVTPTLLGIGPARDAFDETGAPREEAIAKKVDQQVRELIHFSRGGI